MRYLFGDAEQFPEAYNFLDTLRGFVECAGQAATLEHEIGEREDELARQVADRTQEMEVLSGFCEGVIEDMKARAAGNPETTAPIASRLIESVTQILDEARSSYGRESQERRTTAEAEIDEKRKEIRRRVDTFLTQTTLSVESSSFDMRLTGHAVSLSASADHPGGIATSFDLDPSKSQSWSVPQKVQDIMPGLTIQVGMKKKFLSKELTPEVIQLDDHIITEVHLSPEACEVHARRRLEATEDSLVLKMSRANGELVARTAQPGVDADERPAEPEDLPKLDALWQAIEGRCAEAMPHKLRLRSVRLDNAEVFDNGLLMSLVQRLIEQFAPLSREIARRSPNPGELSLKIDRGDGRREEIYIRKEDLVRPLANLPQSLRQSFAPLEIFPPLSVMPPL